MTRVPLGAHVDADGVGFAVFSGVADAIELCLFDEQGQETRRPLEQDEGYLWRGHVAGLGHGVRYGFRVHGPWDPSAGVRCNPAKLLLDPYARAIQGSVDWNPAVGGEHPGDSAPYVPRSLVHAREFDWEEDRAPERSLEDTIIYELHVGLHELHPAVPEKLRGTYRGLAHPAVIDHLDKLGVTAVELLPVHQFVHDRAGRAAACGTTGATTRSAIFAPHDGYATVGPADGRASSRRWSGLHAAGLEVILDVVYNHTAEGNQHGPTLSLPRHRQRRLLPPR